MGTAPASGTVGRALAAHPGCGKTQPTVRCLPVRSSSARGRAEPQPGRLRFPEF